MINSNLLIVGVEAYRQITYGEAEVMREFEKWIFWMTRVSL